MKAIVVNTKTRAVSEYSGFPFQSITPTHAGSVMGLFALGGDTDVGVPIVAKAVTGLTKWGGSEQKRLGIVYFSAVVAGAASMTVGDGTTTFKYALQQPTGKELRGVPGKGIRNRYLSFGFENTGGGAFRLDSFEVTVHNSKNRRT